MHTIEQIESKFNKCKSYLQKYFEQLTIEKEKLENYYAKVYQNWDIYDSEGKKIKFTEEGFDKLFADNCSYIDKQSKFINQIVDLHIVQQNKLSRQMSILMAECVERMESEFSEEWHEDILFSLFCKTDFEVEYVSIILLSKLSSVPQNIVLIGGNGSGKSSFAKTLKGNDRENISVIPAQKSLYFSLNDMSMLSTRLKDLEELLLENNIDKSKSGNDYDYFQFQNNQFTKLIIAMREQYTEYLISCEEKGIIADKYKSIFGRLRNIFEIIFPEIKLHFKTETRDYLCCEKSNHFYHVNSLSEGEKAVLYYTISVLMAKKDSFIVVDEPETYLNPSLANPLWDILTEEREDCQFVFITHSVDFVLGRNDAKIAWIKKFEYPNEWKFEFVDNNFLLPKTMLTEVLGSKKPILFCEGNDKSSLDYRIYQAILGEDYTVIPVGGHLEVIQYCDVITKSKWLGIECRGIIDGDNFPENKISSLKDKKVDVLPFNEIEMFLLSDEVLQYMMNAIYPLEANSKIEEFKKNFWVSVVKKQENIALTRTKIMVDEYLQKQRIENYSSVENIEKSLLGIAQYDIKAIYNKSLERVSEIINKRDYGKLLLICNLKKEISKGVADKYLDSNYEMKAIQQIIKNSELKSILKDKYFGQS